jgi:Flp pilus assembly protein TadD
MAWHLLGVVHAAAGDHSSAVLSFQKALRLKPGATQMEVHMSLGKSLRLLGQIDKVRASLRFAFSRVA